MFETFGAVDIFAEDNNTIIGNKKFTLAVSYVLSETAYCGTIKTGDEHQKCYEHKNSSSGHSMSFVYVKAILWVTYLLKIIPPLLEIVSSLWQCLMFYLKLHIMEP